MRHWLLFLLLLLPAPAAADVLEDESLGPLRWDLAQAEVLQALGPPEDPGEERFEAATGEYVRDWLYEGQGLVVKMGSEEPGGPARLRGARLCAPGTLKSARGVGLGSTYEQVRAAYPGLIEEENSGERTLVVGSIYGGLVFTFEEGKVTSIFLGAAAE